MSFVPLGYKCGPVKTMYDRVENCKIGNRSHILNLTPTFVPSLYPHCLLWPYQITAAFYFSFIILIPSQYLTLDSIFLFWFVDWDGFITSWIWNDFSFGPDASIFTSKFIEPFLQDTLFSLDTFPDLTNHDFSSDLTTLAKVLPVWKTHLTEAVLCKLKTSARPHCRGLKKPLHTPPG